MATWGSLRRFLAGATPLFSDVVRLLSDSVQLLSSAAQLFYDVVRLLGDVAQLFYDVAQSQQQHKGCCIKGCSEVVSSKRGCGQAVSKGEGSCRKSGSEAGSS